MAHAAYSRLDQAPWANPVLWTVLALTLLRAGRRLAATLGLMVLALHLSLVAQAPADPYFGASLEAWEQGRFVRFHGLAQWVGWLWPVRWKMPD